MDGVIGWFLDPYSFEFMRRAIVVLLIVSVVGGVVGTFVVHKGLSFSGDALAHSTLAGVAIAFVNGANVSLGALIAAVATAIGIGWTQRRGRVSYDTAIGILFVAMFSLGILVISRRSSYTPDLFSFVFGNILGVSQDDLIGALVLGGATLLFIAAFRRELIMVAYDPATAATVGVPVQPFQYALLILIAVAVVVALKAIGIVLVNAMLIVPAATASLVLRRIEGIMLLSVAIAVLSSVVGLHLSFHANVATSPTIVLVACALFAITLALTSRRRATIPTDPLGTPEGKPG
jgi:manganese/iron transport system permease protein